MKAAGQKPSAKIIPFRGEYFQIKKERQFLVRNLIYPVPDPKFPFLGVHFTRLIHGGIEAGPNAVLAFAREGYKWSNINLRDLAESLCYPGLWRFLAKYPSMCGYEIRRSLSKAEFTRSLQKLVPEIRADDLETGGAGVRAQAMLPDGKLVEDFHFEEAQRNFARHQRAVAGGHRVTGHREKDFRARAGATEIIYDIGFTIYGPSEIDHARKSYIVNRK